MAFRDTFKNFFTYFEVDDSAELEDSTGHQMPNEQPKLQVAKKEVTREQALPLEKRRGTGSYSSESVANIQRLNERQQELLAINGPEREKKTTIDIKFPKRYEDAPEIVNLLLENASILIDFQFMTEQQARRCLDYLDGARSVLAGNLKKVSNSMWLLTPVNVRVNIDELRNVNSGQHLDGQFDFDMKR